MTAPNAVSVSIGFDGTLGAEAVDALKYSKKFVVTVVDPLGRPVLGAVVSPNVEMVEYVNGFFERDAEFEISGFTRETCPAEDLNNNDVVDSGEDLNGDGRLTPPRSSVAIVPTSGTYTTDATGSVIFELQYPKSYATWVTVALVARATVTGTEGLARENFTTSFVADDEKEPGAPFILSPFSTSVSNLPACTTIVR